MPTDEETKNLRDLDRAARREERRRRLRAQLFDTSVPSPCLAICQMDENNAFCIGCGRNIDEIRDWPILTPDEKRGVLEALAARKATNAA